MTEAFEKISHLLPGNAVYFIVPSRIIENGRSLLLGLIVVSVAGCKHLPGGKTGEKTADLPLVNLADVRSSARKASSLLLSASDRVRAAETFLKLVQIKGPSGQEGAIREKIRRLLLPLGAKEIPLKPGSDGDTPANLVIEIPGTGALADQPALLLNAHMDTIAASDPEKMSFDPVAGDFFHADENVRDKPSSFGADDRSSVAVIVESLRLLHEKFWSRNVPHRPIMLFFSAEEEIGLRGAKHLAASSREVFTNLHISLTMDGPLLATNGPVEIPSSYPRASYVFVVAATNQVLQPYARFLHLAQAFCGRTEKSFDCSELGLGFGDFAAFPAEAKAGLHIWSPVRGWHSQERVKLQDVINHIDLLGYILLAWDDQVPAKTLQNSKLQTRYGTQQRYLTGSRDDALN